MQHKEGERGGGVIVEEGEKRKKKKRKTQGRNQYFRDVATQATANDSKHHEKIWEQRRGKK